MPMCTWTISTRRASRIVQGLTKGKHQITVTGANKGHKLVSATQTITVEVQ